MGVRFLISKLVCNIENWRTLFAGIVTICLCAESADAQLAIPSHDLPPMAQSNAARAFPQQIFAAPNMSQHSPNVQMVLRPEYKLTVERKHSQLLMTRSSVRRLAVTDSAVCNFVQYSPRELAVVGLSLGTTDLMIWFEGQEVPAIYEVTVVADKDLQEQQRLEVSSLQTRIRQLFPNSSVTLVGVGNQVVVKGQAYDSNEATRILQIIRAEVLQATSRQRGDRRPINGIAQVSHIVNPQHPSPPQEPVINMLQIPGEFNIKMRVVIAEVNRTQLRDMGADLNVMFNDGRQGIGASFGGATKSSLSGIFENGEISMLVRWLSTNGTATLLAEPTIVCMSGHSASLLAGGEFAVPTVLGVGGGQSTSFRGVGTSMVVTPTIVDRDLIRLQIVPEFSSLDGTHSVNGIPGTEVKRVRTTVELREGQTLALGGLISRRTSSEVRRVPGLGNLPFVGSRLFHSKNAVDEEVELLVLVTPEIVRPMEPDEVPPLPNFYIAHPNDHDLYKYGRTEGTPDTNVYQAAPFGSGQSHGFPAGYSLQNATAVPQIAVPAMPGQMATPMPLPMQSSSRQQEPMQFHPQSSRQNSAPQRVLTPQPANSGGQQAIPQQSIPQQAVPQQFAPPPAAVPPTETNLPPLTSKSSAGTASEKRFRFWPSFKKKGPTVVPASYK